MCGIIVEILKQGIKSHARGMLDAIAHRGKDKVCIDKYQNINVGYRRLAITDINKDPQFTSWKIYLNGEIYNYTELGFAGCEEEVLSQGFEKHGVGFVHKLNGMFFIVAIFGDQVYCFRDRYGIKPAYYFENENVILIASEIKAILSHPEYDFFINEDAKKQWFVFNNILTDETLFADIYKMDKGTIWSVIGRYKVKYWEWNFKPGKAKDYKDMQRNIKALVFQAVERQKPKEVGFTSCLSGGIDSNIIALNLGMVKTFTVGFEGVVDERHMAKLIGSINETVIFDKVEYLKETIHHMEDLRVGASWSNYGLYKRIAQEPDKVCFDGAGADELFGGYSWRYDAPDYYNVVNRTGIKDEYCEHLFKKVFPVDTLENRFLFDANYFLEAVLLVVDRLSMAHTIEMRIPFLDNDLVDYCLTIPNEFKKNKMLLKSAFEMELPKEILLGAKKGFSSPDWFQGEGNQALKWATVAYKEWETIFKK